LRFVRDDAAAAIVLEELYTSGGELGPTAARQLDVTIRLCLEMHRAGLSPGVEESRDQQQQLTRMDSAVPPLRFK